MAVPTTGQVWEFLVEGRCQGGTTLDINRVRFRLNAVDPNDPIEAAAPMSFLSNRRGIWRTSMLARFCSTYNVFRYNLQVISSVTPQPSRPTQPAVHYTDRIGILGDGNDVGLDLRAPEPDFVSVRARFGAAVINRHTRGGMSISPVADEVITGQQVDPALRPTYLNSVNTVLGSFTDAVNNAQWDAVIFGAQLAIGIPLGANFDQAEVFAQPITSVTIEQYAGSVLHRKQRQPN